MIISAILACSKNNVIGIDGDLPWHLPEDFKFFKRKTLNHDIIMGRKTFISLGRPLPKRTNIVLTRDQNYKADGVVVATSIEDALTIPFEKGEEEVFVIGGGEIYKQFMPYCDYIHMTRVDVFIENGDTFFPEININDWELIEEIKYKKDERHAYDFNIMTYKRIKVLEEE